MTVRAKMTDETLYPIAKLLYEARLISAWGDHWTRRPQWPVTDKDRREYSHNPNPEMDMALDQAKALHDAGVLVE